MEVDTPFDKAQTVDPEVRAYVYSLVNALGGSSADEDGRYVLGDDALACLRDLKRWLKLYDEKLNRLDVSRCLAEANLVNGDLLPILASWPESDSHDKLKARVALSCLELLVPLTWPLEHDGDMTVNLHRHTPFLQQAQVYYKAGILGFTSCSILRQVVRIGLPSIATSREDRTPRDEGIIKLLLYLLRNIAVIQQIPNLPSQGLENEISRSATIQAFRQQDVFALLLTMCSNMGEDFNLQDVIILEILFNLIKGVDVEKLWMTEDQRKGEDLSELNHALTIEKGWQRDFKKHGSLGLSRHGRFGTMIWVKREDEKMSAVSGQDNLRDGRNALFNMDKTKKWSKPQQKRKDLDHTIQDFDRTTRLTSSASELLRNFVEEFLDSGFNPLFTHLRKAIEREAERLLDVNYRQFFYCVAWFLRAERVRRRKAQEEAKDKPQKLASDFEAESYALVAAVLNQETFIMLNRYMQNSYDNKEWQDLNASMRCFTQILLTVQEMAQSPLEEDQEIAENIQNRIFYEETTHDRIVSILRGYKDQGFGYLDACTELAHVFLRMLERYSKENIDLQVRSKRRARQKKKDKSQPPNEFHANGEAATNNEDENDDEDESEKEDLTAAVQVSRERKFDFNRFAAKFVTQSSVDTFIALSSFYRDLDVEQLKRAHRFFHRVAFKQDLAVLLYRVDIVALFYKMIKGPEGLDNKNVMFGDWSELVKQVLRKMFKKIEARPELVVEMLFSKINATLYYLEFGQEKQTLRDTRPPVDVEVRAGPGRDLKDKIGIVVTAMSRDRKTDLIHWVVEILGQAADERKGWEDERAAREALLLEAATNDESAQRPQTDSTEDVSATMKPIRIDVPVGDIQTAAFKNARLRLLLKLVGLERQSDEDILGAPWIVPASLTSTQLQESKDTIAHFEKEPWKGIDADETPESLIKRVRNAEGAHYRDDDDDLVARRDAFIDDSEGQSDVEFDFPDNIRAKRNATQSIAQQIKEKRRQRKRGSDDEGSGSEVDDAVLAARRKARKEAASARRAKIKSGLYIRDSDDETDEEKDREFFRSEEARRKRQEARIREAMRVGAARAEDGTEGGRKRKSDGVASKGQKKRKTNGATPSDPGAGQAPDDDLPTARTHDEASAASDDDDGTATASSQLHRASGFSSDDQAEDDEDDTPLSSPSRTQFSSPIPGPGQALKELSQPRAAEVASRSAAAAPTTVSTATAGGKRYRRAGADDRADEDAAAAAGAGAGGQLDAVGSGDGDGDEDTDGDGEDAVMPRTVVPSRSRGRVRAGFVFDSDDEE